ncbi:MAG: HAD hydrolase-like protein [Pseudomonadota bacterium]|nr:HAD hydrolase-like protein [Pseudomonadota bacterium]
MRTVIFDLDGTLADTSRDLIDAANACFVTLGHGAPLDAVADAATAFRGGRAMLTLGFERVLPEFTEGDIDREHPIFLDHYARDLDRHTRMYDGAVAAVERLRAAGVRVGVCTNKPEGLAQDLLTRLGVRDLFGSLIGADTLPTRKPDPAPYVASVHGVGGDVAQSILIGDTITDRKTAAAVGIPCVLVTFGPTGRAVADLNPEALLDHYDDLDGIVDRLIPAGA